MRETIAKLGQVKTIILITIFAIISSELIYIMLAYFIIGEVRSIGFFISFIAPAILAPITSWFTIGLLIKVHYLELEMRELATYDDLTKVLSRKAFLTNAEILYQLAKRDRTSLAMLYIDIDDFKNINDKYGHSIGDKVLTLFGDILKESKRESDLVGRLGGEEFAYILPSTDSVGASSFAKNLKEKLKESYLEHDNLKINYTISIGVSIYSTENNVKLEELINQADEVLYSAKHSGKNKVVIY